MPVDHYENFPVASLLLPKHLREPVEAIYAFARGADDVADEGDADADTRLAQLAEYHAGIDAIEFRMPANDDDLRPMFERLERNVREFDLPLQPFRDLVSAFAQDVVKTRYASYDEVLDYCRRSANPVGRLLLHLYGVSEPAALHQSDAICTALQLINFWQDLGEDVKRGRLYVPLADCARHGVDPAALIAGRDSPATRQLMADACAWARNLMQQGLPLPAGVHRHTDGAHGRLAAWRLAWELRLVMQGGLRILERIAAHEHDTLRHRPVLRPSDWPVLWWHAWRAPTAARP